MTVLRKPERRRFIRTAVAVVGIGAAGFALWLLAGFAGPNLAGNTTYQQVQATVTSTVSCASPNASDAVSFTLDGLRHTGQLSGCGNPTGSTVTVLVSLGFTDGGTVSLASAAPGNSAGLSQRVSFLLLIVAAAVGGASAYFFARQPGRRGRPVEKHQPKLETIGGKGLEPLDAPAISRDLPRLESTEAHDVDWFEDSATDLRADSADHKN